MESKPSLGSLHRKSFKAQRMTESFPTTIGIAPVKTSRSFAEKTLPKHFAFGEQTSKLTKHDPPSPQLCHVVTQLRAEVCNLQSVVRQLVELQSVALHKAKDNTELGENKVHNNNVHNNNNNNENNNDHNKNSRESSFTSLDLDNDNPESEPDLENTSLDSFNAESSLRSLDQQEACQSLQIIGLSLGSLEEDAEQEGQRIGTAWDQSLDPSKPKCQKRVTFSKATLEAYKSRQQNKKNGQNSYKDSLEDELSENNAMDKTTTACWNNFQQQHQMQQQPATALANELQHRTCNNYSLGSEDESIGNLESETHKQACRSPKHNSNTKSLGIGSKNTAAWGIMIDTGAAISLAPVSFAQSTELSPLEGTYHLRTATGEAIQAYGRRTVELRGSQLSLLVSFVIADVQQALLGMDVLMTHQLSLQQNSNNEHWLVNLEATKPSFTKEDIIFI